MPGECARVILLHSDAGEEPYLLLVLGLLAVAPLAVRAAVLREAVSAIENFFSSHLDEAGEPWGATRRPRGRRGQPPDGSNGQGVRHAESPAWEKG